MAPSAPLRASLAAARPRLASTSALRTCSRTLVQQSTRQVPIGVRGVANLASFKIPKVSNEPNLHYGKGSPDRAKLKAALKKLKADGAYSVPLVVGGEHITNSSTQKQPNPANHAETVATYSTANASQVNTAIQAALDAKPAWEAMSFADRAAIFLKAADLVGGKYRYEIMAATMLGQGKNAWQAEIDAAAELADFLRFSVQYAEELYAQQPVHNSPGVWNRVEYRPLEGFVYAVSPFNFTAIGGNLVVAPALMGNVVVWKPSDYAIAANWLTYKILLEAGLPPNVIQFTPGNPVEITDAVLAHKDFASLHYTGSTAIFRQLYGKIANGVAEGKYKSYPRIVGETGGKNFHLVHESADVHNAAINTIRGAFEYQGQKCSATSRAYVSSKVWPQFKKVLVEETQKLKQGAPEDFGNFVGPVIHQGAFDRLAGAIDAANKDSALECIAGGTYDSSKGYYVAPSIYVTKDPQHDLMSRELFGPVLSIYVYDDASPAAFTDTIRLIDSTTSYGLTGAVFAQDRAAVATATEGLRNAAGNFYINVKSTGAVVGQQPFGGARASGTNDKAGSQAILGRFVSMRSIKEDFVGADVVEYPSNEV